MVKKVRTKPGFFFGAARVAVGWLSFIAGQFASDLVSKCVLLSIARVLPYASFGHDA